MSFYHSVMGPILSLAIGLSPIELASEVAEQAMDIYGYHATAAQLIDSDPSRFWIHMYCTSLEGFSEDYIHEFRFTEQGVTSDYEWQGQGCPDWL